MNSAKVIATKSMSIKRSLTSVVCCVLYVWYIVCIWYSGMAEGVTQISLYGSWHLTLGTHRASTQRV